MKPAIALALLVPASLLPGCPYECGTYDGAGDQMFRRGDDVLFLCNNGGFTLTLAGQASAGRFDQGADGVAAANGETGARAFSFQVAADGTASSPELGSGWREVLLDQTALDHADVQCTGLQSQPWWTPSVDALPAMTALRKPAGGFASTAECQAAQRAGTYPTTSRCEDTVLLCPNHQLVRTAASGVETGSYSASAGEIDAVSPAGEIQGVFAADGALRTGSDLWQQIPVDHADPAVVDAGCGA